MAARSPWRENTGSQLCRALSGPPRPTSHGQAAWAGRCRGTTWESMEKLFWPTFHQNCVGQGEQTGEESTRLKVLTKSSKRCTTSLLAMPSQSRTATARVCARVSCSPKEMRHLPDVLRHARVPSTAGYVLWSFQCAVKGSCTPLRRGRDVWSDFI